MGKMWKCQLESHVACVKRSSTNTRRQLFSASLFSFVTSPEAGGDVMGRGLQGLSEAEEVEGGSEVTRFCLFMITDMIMNCSKGFFGSASRYYRGLRSTEQIISHSPAPSSPRLSHFYICL